MAQYTVQELLDEYIYQRESGNVSGDILKSMREFINQLREVDQRQLSQWIREWELYRPDDFSAAEQTRPVITPGTRLTPSAQQQVLETQPDRILCPHCSTANPHEAKYCYSCGELLVAMQLDPKTAQLDEDELEDGSIFGKLSTLILTVRGYERDPARIRFEGKPLMIGRIVQGSTLVPDVDLSPYGAMDLGVSRIHAIFEQENQTLTIVDQGSINHTYINGEKLHPHEKRVVRDGDEIRFARLVARATFQRELRRL